MNPLSGPIRRTDEVERDLERPASTSKYVFPAEDGSMRSDETDLQQVLRRALGRAGIALGYDFLRRQKGCGHRDASPAPLPRLARDHGDAPRARRRTAGCRAADPAPLGSAADRGRLLAR